MTPTTPPPTTRTPTTSSGPLRLGRARWLVASLFLIGTVLQAVEFLAETPKEDYSERVAYWSEHSTRVEVAAAAGLLAVPFLIGGFAVLVALCRTSTPRLAWTAAGFLTLAMVGLGAIHGLEMGAYWLTRAGDRSAAVTILETEDPALPGVVLFVMFLGGAVLGVLTLVVATWSSPYVPRLVPLFLLAFAVLDFALGYGVVAHVLNVAAGLLVAWAVVTGYTRVTPARTEGATTSMPRPRAGHRGRHSTTA